MTDPVTRLTSALADRYRIERELGQGGMATVYLAEDVRHHRKVAIKVLHPELSAVLGPDRFLKEIELTANLQHPHILPLFDSGATDGLLYYVMPYVEGETLRNRLSREKQLPIPDAVRIASEVASALDYAHRRNVIHRDIKPENILLHDGQALVADFGIAIAVAQAGGNRMTQTGMSLGTPQYMSPEQAMGEREISARSDLYALGCVTYEMLAGEPPFTGPTAQAIVARVMTEEPRSLIPQRRTVPAHLDSAVLTALAKLPADRFASAAAFAQAMNDPKFTSTSPGLAQGRSVTRVAGRPRQWLQVAVALNVVLAGAALYLLLKPGPEQGTSRQQVLLWHSPLPQALDPGATVVASQAAIAPDGSSVVFSDSSATGFQLMRKDRGSAQAVPLAGTEGAVSPFFSPDGKWVGYITLDGKLRKVPVTGGGSVTLAEDAVGDYKAGAWLADQTIVYISASWMARVSAGSPTEPTRLKKHGGAIAATISALPDARGVLFTLCNGNCSVQSDLYVYDLKADSGYVLVPQAAGGWYAPTGELLYTSREGGLYAAGFDLGRLAITSGAVPVIEGVEPTAFAISSSGAVLYATDRASREELVWVTREGQVAPVDTTWRGSFEYPAISPDGKSLAVSLREKTTDLWIRDGSGARQKVLAGGVTSWRASWMPDGKALTFISVRSPDTPNAVVVMRAQADGVGRAEPLLRHRYGVWETEVSRDGRWLVIRTDEENNDGHVYARRLDGGDTTLVPIAVEHQTIQIALSPDGRWLAYCSDEAGERELYVLSFPDLRSQRLVSRGGASEPRWARNGRELYFKSRGQLMVVEVSPGASWAAGNPRPLFSIVGFRRARNRPQYDVAPDGRFLMIRESGAGGGLMYVENWFAELRARLRQ